MNNNKHAKNIFIYLHYNTTSMCITMGEKKIRKKKEKSFIISLLSQLKCSILYILKYILYHILYNLCQPMREKYNKTNFSFCLFILNIIHVFIIITKPQLLSFNCPNLSSVQQFFLLLLYNVYRLYVSCIMYIIHKLYLFI